MKGEGTEGASAKAAPVAYQAEFHFLNGRHTTGLFIAGMISTAVGKIVNSIHFLGSQRLLGRILHHKFLAVRLSQPLGGEGVTVAVLHLEAFCIEPLVFLYLFKGG